MLPSAGRACSSGERQAPYTRALPAGPCCPSAARRRRCHRDYEPRHRLMLSTSNLCLRPLDPTSCRYKLLKKTLKECRLQAAAAADGDASGGEEPGSATPPAALPAAAPATAAEAAAAAAHLRGAEARFFELLEGELLKANRWACPLLACLLGRCLLPVWPSHVVLGASPSLSAHPAPSLPSSSAPPSPRCCAAGAL
jgi:hypothetical protein